MKEKTHLLIVGAGPFGLSLAAYLKDNNIEHIHLGHRRFPKINSYLIQIVGFLKA